MAATDGERALALITAALNGRGLEFASEDVQHGKKLTVRAGLQTSYVTVYDSGALVVGGGASKLKETLEEIKNALVKGDAVLGALPFDIERFPETLKERVPQVDDVIITFLGEGIRCLQAKALLAATFMLGAASERAIDQLIETYKNAFEDPRHKAEFEKRANRRYISIRFDEFTRSYKSCTTRPTDPKFHDIDTLLGQTFQFYRMTRNDVGHPQTAGSLDHGVLVANYGQFITYMERVYALIEHFTKTPVKI